MRIFYLFMCLLITSAVGLSQDKRMTEEEIIIESQFIDSYKGIITRNYDKTIDALETLKKEDRGNDGIHYEFAKAFYYDKNMIEAENHIQKAIELSPKNYWYYYFYSTILIENNKSSQAILPLTKMHQMHPDDIELSMQLAYTYQENGEFKSAIDIYDELETKQGIQEEFSKDKYQLYLSLNKNKQALKELEKLSNVYPTNTRYLNNLASAYFKLGKKKKAQQTYKKTLQIDPSNPTATMVMSGSLTKKGNESAYLSALNVLIVSPNISLDQKLRELIPFVEDIEKGSAEDLKMELKQVIENLQNTHYDNAKVYAIFGDYYMNIGDTQNATKKYIKTLALNENVFAVWVQLFYALEDQKDFDKLLDYTNEALDLYPNQGISYYFNGLALNRKADFSASNDILEDALLFTRKNKNIQYLSIVIAANNDLHLDNNKSAKLKLDKAENMFDTEHPYFLETQRLYLNEAPLEEEKSKIKGN